MPVNATLTVARTLVPSTQFSVDGINFEPIPIGINVTGSRYAVILDEIKPSKIEIPMNTYEIAYGKSKGRIATDYIRGHVDKACLELNQARLIDSDSESKIKTISYMAKMRDQFAVFVK